MWGYDIYSATVCIRHRVIKICVAICCIVHSNRHDCYSWQTGLIPDILPFIMQLYLQVFRSNPQDGWSIPKSSDSFFLPPPGKKSNLYFCGFDNWVSFKSVNMITLSFFRGDQRSLTLHECISSSCTWLYSSNVLFPFFLLTTVLGTRECKHRQNSSPMTTRGLSHQVDSISQLNVSSPLLAGKSLRFPW